MVKLIFENAFGLLLSVCLLALPCRDSRECYFWWIPADLKQEKKRKDLVMPPSTSPGSQRKKWNFHACLPACPPICLTAEESSNPPSNPEILE
jgi:hypothetical protein